MKKPAPPIKIRRKKPSKGLVKPPTALESLVEVYKQTIEDLRVELAAARDREGWYQQRFMEERDRSNSAADVLIVENGRRPLTHISEQIMSVRSEGAKKVDEAMREEDPFETLPFGDPDGTYATAEEASEGLAGEL